MCQCGHSIHEHILGNIVGHRFCSCEQFRKETPMDPDYMADNGDYLDCGEFGLVSREDNPLAVFVFVHKVVIIGHHGAVTEYSR